MEQPKHRRHNHFVTGHRCSHPVNYPFPLCQLFLPTFLTCQLLLFRLVKLLPRSTCLSPGAVQLLAEGVSSITVSDACNPFNNATATVTVARPSELRFLSSATEVQVTEIATKASRIECYTFFFF